MDWSQVIHIGEVVGAIGLVCGFLISIFVNLRKLVHVYDKIEDLVENSQKTNNTITEIKKELKEELQEQSRLANLRKELLLGVARQILLERFDKVLSAGEISTAEFKTLSTLYRAYEVNGGNSVIHDMWELVIQLPIKNK